MCVIPSCLLWIYPSCGFIKDCLNYSSSLCAFCTPQPVTLIYSPVWFVLSGKNGRFSITIGQIACQLNPQWRVNSYLFLLKINATALFKFWNVHSVLECLYLSTACLTNSISTAWVARWRKTQRTVAMEASKQTGSKILPDLKSFGI